MSTYRLLPPRYPQYFDRAEGCRLWDADGNEYIDFMCSFGPMIAGYGNPRIRAAANAQRDRLDIANGPPPLIVDLAERFVRQVGHAEWAIFAKNGNDATTVCNMVARARSEKRKILVAKGAYHGAAPWANHISRGTPAEDHVHFPTYRYKRHREPGSGRPGRRPATWPASSCPRSSTTLVTTRSSPTSPSRAASARSVTPKARR